MRQRRLQAHWLVFTEVLVTAIILLVLFTIIVFPILNRARENPHHLSCEGNQHQIALIAIMYAQDHGETLPSVDVLWKQVGAPGRAPAHHWYTASLEPKRYRGLTVCPNIDTFRNGYVYNSTVAGKNLGDPEILREGSVNDASRVFLTADGQHTTADGRSPNVAYSLADIDRTRHAGGFIASFLDGHTELQKPEDAKGWFPNSAPAVQSPPPVPSP